MQGIQDKVPSTAEVQNTREYKKKSWWRRYFPERIWGPPTHKGYSVSYPGRAVNHLPPSGAEVKDRVELYLYPPPLLNRGSVFRANFY